MKIDCCVKLQSVSSTNSWYLHECVGDLDVLTDCIRPKLLLWAVVIPCVLFTYYVSLFARDTVAWQCSGQGGRLTIKRLQLDSRPFHFYVMTLWASCSHTHMQYNLPGSHGSWKFLKFEFGFFRTWKVLKLDRDAEKVLNLAIVFLKNQVSDRVIVAV